mmetsp:Transcript_88681/g.185365  ORF Transcript_88681/g.185365 Transcript_88681/m.185365 type:complete len:365 (+) Transcript_88681:51-1145(+)
MAAKLEDSNCALLGSDEDKRVRHAAALEEPAWREAGKGPGVQVWRAEEFKVVPWPTDKYGPQWIELKTGDSFIILQTIANEGELEHHIFFWLGQETSLDEQGTVAYKAVELDAYFDGQASHSREIQGRESEEFRKIFPRISYTAGGVDSGFHHTIADVYEARLIEVRKTKQGVVHKHVPLSRESLNHADCFVLDNGRNIYIWCGDECEALEKYEANVLAENLESSRRGLATATHEVDEAFWRLLGGEGYIKSAAEAPAKIKEIEVKDGILFKLSDSNGELTMKEVARRDLHKSMLDSNHVMILDHGNEMFVWIGSNADEVEKKNAYQSVIVLLQTNGMDAYVPIHILKEGKQIQHRLWNEIFSK